MTQDEMQTELAKHGIRTELQNNSLHLSMRQFAEALNDSGWPLSTAIDAGKINLELGWVEGNIKEIFREIMKYKFPDKKWKNPDRPSTKELETVELSECWEILNKAMGEKFGVTLPFPCQESLYYEATYGKAG